MDKNKDIDKTNTIIMIATPMSVNPLYIAYKNEELRKEREEKLNKLLDK